MSEIEIEFRTSEAKGIGLNIDRWGDVVLSFGEVRLGTLIEKIGQARILEYIGKEVVIEHFEIVEAEDDKP